MPARLSLLLLTIATVVLGNSCDNVAWGTFQEAIYSSDVVNVNQNFDTAVGRSQDIFQVYVNWDDGYQGPNNNDFSAWNDFPKWIKSMETYTSVGGANTRLPLITWQPWGSPYTSSNNKYPFSAISSGTYDTYIDSFFKVMRTLGPVVYVRLAHEFDGNWYPWGAVNGNTGASFQSMWKHVVGRARATNTTNVQFVWCPNNSNGNGVYFEGYYPGNSFVDWVCLDAYADNAAVSFAQTITTAAAPAQPYQRLVNLTSASKPIMIAEFGMITKNDTTYGTWFHTMMSGLQSIFPQIRAVVLFNTDAYKMNTGSPTLSATMKSALNAPINNTLCLLDNPGNDIKPSNDASTTTPWLAALILISFALYY